MFGVLRARLVHPADSTFRTEWNVATFVLVWYLEAVDSPWLFLALGVKVLVCCQSCKNGRKLRHATGWSKLPHWLFWLTVMVVTPVICGLWPVLTN